MKKKILSIALLSLLILSGYIIQRINDPRISDTIINSYHSSDIKLIIALLLVCILMIICLRFFFQKDNKASSIGISVTNHEQENKKRGSSSEKYISNKIKNKINRYFMFRVLSFLMIPLYTSVYFFFIDITESSLEKNILYTAIIISIIINIGLFFRAIWTWYLIRIFSFMHLIWFPFGTIFGFLLFLLSIFCMPEEINELKTKK